LKEYIAWSIKVYIEENNISSLLFPSDFSSWLMGTSFWEFLFLEHTEILFQKVNQEYTTKILAWYRAPKMFYVMFLPFWLWLFELLMLKLSVVFLQNLPTRMLFFESLTFFCRYIDKKKVAKYYSSSYSRMQKQICSRYTKTQIFPQKNPIKTLNVDFLPFSCFNFYTPIPTYIYCCNSFKPLSNT